MSMHPNPTASSAANCNPRAEAGGALANPTAERLYAAHRAELLAYIRRHVPAGVGAEDVLHEIFVRLARQQRSDESLRHPRAWLYRVARRLLIDQYRRQAMFEPLPDDLADRPQRLTPGEELAQCLTPLLNQLDEPYRSALRAADFDETPLKRIAEDQGLSLSGMKSRVQRARRQLHQAVLRCCELSLNASGAVDDYRVKDPAAAPCGRPSRRFD